MSLQLYDQPEYLFCEIEPKDGSFNDHRIWIYHRLSLSLIEFVDMTAVSIDGLDEGTDFEYGAERYRGIFVQNNCELTGNDPTSVMSGAWEYLENYFKWEDAQ